MMDPQKNRAHSEEESEERDAPSPDLYLVAGKQAEISARNEPAPARARDTAEPFGLRKARVVIRQLRDKIAHEKEQLHAMTEEYETAAEAMAASNEQMWTVNEQLRSKDEELEAAKEELQVVNDELQVLNDELRNKLEEINRVNSDLQDPVTPRAEQIERLASKRILSEQAERQRIAQILHDELQQLLIALQMRVTMLNRGRSAEQAARLSEAATLIAQALNVTRTLTVDLSPPVLTGEDADIAATLDWLVLRMADMHRLRVEVASTCPVRVRPT